jgi:glutaconate CoA-transferase subunit B
MTSSGKVFIVMRQTPRSFVRELDFMTTLGHGKSGVERAALGLKGKGPALLVTDLCIMRPEAGTQEFMVTSLHPGVTRERVVENTRWSLRFAETVEETAPPEPGELEVLRDLQARTALAHGGG